MEIVQSTPQTASVVQAIGTAANKQARKHLLADYLSRKAANTRKRHAVDIQTFAQYLDDISPGAGDGFQTFAAEVADFPNVVPDIRVWEGVEWGTVFYFRAWMLEQGYATGTINIKLSTLRKYISLAAVAEVIRPEVAAALRSITGYSGKEAKNVDEERELTRYPKPGAKKAEPTRLTQEQAKKLLDQPDTPQGRRDRVLMCLLLEHGLRVGEVAALRVGDVDLKAGELRFYRPKVNKVQTHKLSAATLQALQAWASSGDMPTMPGDKLLRGSKVGGVLTEAGMSERSIRARVRYLGEKLGISKLSPHDCRHYWATLWAKRVDVLRLQEAGGWSSLVMPRRYVEDSKIANEGMV